MENISNTEQKHKSIKITTLEEYMIQEPSRNYAGNTTKCINSHNIPISMNNCPECERITKQYLELFTK